MDVLKVVDQADADEKAREEREHRGELSADKAEDAPSTERKSLPTLSPTGPSDSPLLVAPQSPVVETYI